MPLYALDDRTPTLPADDRCWVAPDANVIGNVVLGEDVGIWFGATLRGDNEPITVGARSNIQEGVVVHTDPGNPATIGDNSLVGMGATVLNGAVIGRNCLVGANALVTEGKVFPDNSLIVGAPARLARTLDDAAVEGLKRSADSYVRNWQRFKKGLKPIG